MSKLTDIKDRINHLDGGPFQELCDAYLTCRGYGNGYSLGMKTGTHKTAPGSPDAYFLTADKRYVFAMYTTQKRDFVVKAMDDIDKCFDSEKTGVSAEDVAEIIYCHTYDRLTPGDDRGLRKYCEDRGVALTLIGLDELGNDIFYEYPILAKEFLGISIDSGQIMPLDIFVAKHDANEMSAPLGTEFLLREEELEKARAALSRNDVLLIAGPAGVGKTRFALELCRQLAEEKDYDVLAIKSNDLELYDDLVTAIERGKEYLVLVDDANQLSGLHHALDFLPKMSGRTRQIAKLVLTVRDYARKEVMEQTKEFTEPGMLKLAPFKDDGIRKLMETCFGITNRLYTDRIVAIAEGNARLAMLAGKLAAESQNLAAIRDASGLYHSYYHNQLNAVISGKTGICSAGIIAFLQSVHLDHLESLNPIFDTLGISKDDFIADLKLLHKAEIVDLYYDKAARISDQSFSNFLIKYVFVEEKAIPLSTMIETCFPISQNRTIYACSVLLQVFSDQAVREHVESQINIVWDKIERDEKSFLPFFKVFHMVRPTQTLLLIKEWIEQEPCHPFDVQTLAHGDNRPAGDATDDILQILGSFERHNDLPTALELMLLYYKKRPDLYGQFYNTLAERFGVGMDSQRFGYYTQSTTVEHLCAAIDANPDDSNLLYLFVRVAGRFLEFDFSKTEGGRHNTISFYTLELPPDEAVLAYRKKLLSQIYQIYQRGNMHTEIEHMLRSYGIPHHESDTYLEVVRAEFAEVLRFFSSFQEENLYHCVIARHMEQIAERIDYDASDTLVPFLNSEKCKIYSALAKNHLGDFSQGYDPRGIEKHKGRVKKLTESYTPQDIDCLIQVCMESIRSFDKEERELAFGLGYVFETLQDRKALYLYLVEAYLKADTPYKICGSMILAKLFEFMPASEVKRFITQYRCEQQNAWLWYFYASMPEQQISGRWAEELLHYLDNPDTKLKAAPYRTIDMLSKYEAADPQIIFNALRIIASHFEESPFVFSLYAFDILNTESQENAEEILKKFSKELPLLEDIYLKGISYSAQEDYNGVLLFAIISVDPFFLRKYVDQLIAVHESSRFNSDYNTERILKIWDADCFMDFADTVFDCLYQKKKSLYWRFDSPLSKMLCNQSNHPEIIPKQDLWIEHVIEQYSFDEARMYELFSAIAELSSERRRRAVERFLSLNDDPDLFEKLPLEPLSYGGWGSMIPYMQERIEYLSSLLPSVSGLKYLKQKQRIERDIDGWKAQIRSEEVSELLESWLN